MIVHVVNGSNCITGEGENDKAREELIYVQITTPGSQVPLISFIISYALVMALTSSLSF